MCAGAAAGPQGTVLGEPPRTTPARHPPTAVARCLYVRVVRRTRHRIPVLRRSAAVSVLVVVCYPHRYSLPGPLPSPPPPPSTAAACLGPRPMTPTLFPEGTGRPRSVGEAGTRSVAALAPKRTAVLVAVVIVPGGNTVSRGPSSTARGWHHVGVEVACRPRMGINLVPDLAFGRKLHSRHGGMSLIFLGAPRSGCCSWPRHMSPCPWPLNPSIPIHHCDSDGCRPREMSTVVRVLVQLQLLPGESTFGPSTRTRSSYHPYS